MSSKLGDGEDGRLPGADLVDVPLGDLGVHLHRFEIAGEDEERTRRRPHRLADVDLAIEHDVAPLRPLARRDRHPDLGLLERELGLLHERAGRLDLRLGEQESRVGRLHGAPGLFEIGAEAAALGELLLHANRGLRSVLAGHRLGERRFRRREAVLGLLELEPILAIIERRQHGPFRDDIADADMQVLHGAGNLAADDDLIARFEDAGGADDVAHGAVEERARA